MMDFASVPKTAIKEHGNALSPKHNVWRSWQVASLDTKALQARVDQ